MTGKVKAWLMTMEEDACEMTRKEFLAKHSEHNIDVFECILDQARAERNQFFKDAHNEMQKVFNH
jgi:hypothetical protein